MGTQSYKNGYADKLIFWNEQLILSQTKSIEQPRYSEEKCKKSILYFTEKHEEWKSQNEGSNPLTYYTGSELKWSTEDVLRNAEHLDIKLTDEEAESILIATFENNDAIMEFINDEILETINFKRRTVCAKK